MLKKTLRGSAAANLELVWAAVQDYYATYRVTTQLSKLQLSMFCDPKAPHAHFPVATTKGKETEYLCLALEHVWAEQCDMENPHDISVAAVLASVGTVYRLARAPAQPDVYQLSDAQWLELTQAVDTLLAHYTALSNSAAAEGVLRWNVTVKHHVLWHWGRQARLLHPSRTACYIDEHFCGVVANIVKAFTGGKRINRAGETLLFKWQTGVLLQWSAAYHGGHAQWARPRPPQ